MRRNKHYGSRCTSIALLPSLAENWHWWIYSSPGRPGNERNLQYLMVSPRLSLVRERNLGENSSILTAGSAFSFIFPEATLLFITTD